MIKKIKQKFKKEENKRLLSNFFSLLILQGANYIFPLITFPYLVRVLGIEKYGLLAFAGATIAYFNILTDYGFGLSATKEISIYRDDKEKLNEIFSSVMIIKFILMIVSFLLLLILVYSFNKFKLHSEVFLLTFGTVIGQVLFPQWFFQGIERMKYITLLNILSKTIFTIAIFIFIHKESDYWKVPLINSLGYISAGLIALYIIQKDFGIKFQLQTLNTLKNYVIDGWHVFISRVFISSFTNTNIFLIGIFFDNKIVGYYSVADKLINIIKSFLSIISQVFFPYISKLMQENKYKALNIIKKIIINIVLLLLIILIIIYFIAPFILEILIKENYEITLKIFRIFLILPLVIFISMIIGQQILLPLKHMKLFTNSLITMGIMHLIFIYPVIKLFGILGVVWLVVFTETSIMLYRLIGVYLLKKKGLL